MDWIEKESLFLNKYENLSNSSCSSIDSPQRGHFERRESLRKSSLIRSSIRRLGSRFKASASVPSSSGLSFSPTSVSTKELEKRSVLGCRSPKGVNDSFKKKKERKVSDLKLKKKLKAEKDVLSKSLKTEETKSLLQSLRSHFKSQRKKKARPVTMGEISAPIQIEEPLYESIPEFREMLIDGNRSSSCFFPPEIFPIAGGAGICERAHELQVPKNAENLRISANSKTTPMEEKMTMAAEAKRMEIKRTECPNRVANMDLAQVEPYLFDRRTVKNKVGSLPLKATKDLDTFSSKLLKSREEFNGINRVFQAGGLELRSAQTSVKSCNPFIREPSEPSKLDETFSVPDTNPIVTSNRKARGLGYGLVLPNPDLCSLSHHPLNSQVGPVGSLSSSDSGCDSYDDSDGNLSVHRMDISEEEEREKEKLEASALELASLISDSDPELGSSKSAREEQRVFKLNQKNLSTINEISETFLSDSTHRSDQSEVDSAKTSKYQNPVFDNVETLPQIKHQEAFRFESDDSLVAIDLSCKNSNRKCLSPNIEKQPPFLGEDSNLNGTFIVDAALKNRLNFAKCPENIDSRSGKLDVSLDESSKPQQSPLSFFPSTPQVDLSPLSYPQFLNGTFVLDKVASNEIKAPQVCPTPSSFLSEEEKKEVINDDEDDAECTCSRGRKAKGKAFRSNKTHEQLLSKNECKSGETAQLSEGQAVKRLEIWLSSEAESVEKGLKNLNSGAQTNPFLPASMPTAQSKSLSPVDLPNPKHPAFFNEPRASGTLNDDDYGFLGERFQKNVDQMKQEAGETTVKKSVRFQDDDNSLAKPLARVICFETSFENSADDKNRPCCYDSVSDNYTYCYENEALNDDSLTDESCQPSQEDKELQHKVRALFEKSMPQKNDSKLKNMLKMKRIRVNSRSSKRNQLPSPFIFKSKKGKGKSMDSDGNENLPLRDITDSYALRDQKINSLLFGTKNQGNTARQLFSPIPKTGATTRLSENNGKAKHFFDDGRLPRQIDKIDNVRKGSSHLDPSSENFSFHNHVSNANKTGKSGKIGNPVNADQFFKLKKKSVQPVVLKDFQSQVTSFYMSKDEFDRLKNASKSSRLKEITAVEESDVKSWSLRRSIMSNKANENARIPKSHRVLGITSDPPDPLVSKDSDVEQKLDNFIASIENESERREIEKSMEEIEKNIFQLKFEENKENFNENLVRKFKVLKERGKSNTNSNINTKSSGQLNKDEAETGAWTAKPNNVKEKDKRSCNAPGNQSNLVKCATGVDGLIQSRNRSSKAASSSVSSLSQPKETMGSSEVELVARADEIAKLLVTRESTGSENSSSRVRVRAENATAISTTTTPVAGKTTKAKKKNNATGSQGVPRFSPTLNCDGKVNSDERTSCATRPSNRRKKHPKPMNEGVNAVGSKPTHLSEQTEQLGKADEQGVSVNSVNSVTTSNSVNSVNSGSRMKISPESRSSQLQVVSGPSLSAGLPRIGREKSGSVPDISCYRNGSNNNNKKNKRGSSNGPRTVKRSSSVMTRRQSLDSMLEKSNLLEKRKQDLKQSRAENYDSRSSSSASFRITSQTKGSTPEKDVMDNVDTDNTPRRKKMHHIDIHLHALFAAVEHGHVDKARTILESTDVDLNSMNSDGLSLLDVAVLSNNKALVQLLIAFGAREGNKFATAESMGSHLRQLLNEAERKVQELGGGLLLDQLSMLGNSVSTNARASLSIPDPSDKTLSLWERRTKGLKKMLLGFDQARPPDVPFVVEVEVTKSNSVTVRYQEPEHHDSPVCTKFRVEWSKDSDFRTLSGSQDIFDTKQLECNVENLEHGQRYYFRVACGNIKGFSQFRNSTPTCITPSSWRDITQKKERLSPDKLILLDQLFSEIRSSRPDIKHVGDPSAPGETPLGQRKKKTTIKQLFTAASKFQKHLRRGVFLSCLLYHEDKILVTNEDFLPVIEVDETYPGSIYHDFHWLLKVACTWDDVKWLRNDMEKSLNSSTVHFRIKLLQAAAQMQTALSIQDLGQLYHKPLRDSEGTIVICTVNYIRSPKSISVLNSKWLPLGKIIKRTNSVNPSESNVGDILMSSIQDQITYHQVSSMRLHRGLYLGYLKMRSSVDLLQVLVPSKTPNVPPHCKIRNNPHVTAEEWEWLTGGCEKKNGTELQKLFGEQVASTARRLFTYMQVSPEQSSQHRFYDGEVVELSNEVSLLMIVPPVETACSAPGQRELLLQRTDMLPLPVQVFEMVHLGTYQRLLVSRYSRLSCIIELDTALAHHSHREAFSNSEVNIAKERLAKLAALQVKLNTVWKQARWLLDVLAFARDRLSHSPTIMKQLLTIHPKRSHHQLDSSSGLLQPPDTKAVKSRGSWPGPGVARLLGTVTAELSRSEQQLSSSSPISAPPPPLPPPRPPPPVPLISSIAITPGNSSSRLAPSKSEDTLAHHVTLSRLTTSPLLHNKPGGSMLNVSSSLHSLSSDDSISASRSKSEGEEEGTTVPAPAPGILQIYAAYNTGLAAGTSLKLHVSPRTSAREVVDLVVKQLNMAVVLKGKDGPIYPSDQLNNFCLVAVIGARERCLRDDFKPLQLQNPWKKGRLYVRQKQDVLAALEHSSRHSFVPLK